jgi:alpha-glucosidase (family GH31 glycosyl hydrolase)
MFPYFEHMRDAMRLRNALTPYLYTESRRFFDTGVAPLHPLYYDWPKDEKVYETLVVEREYMFGHRILAQPVTKVSSARPAQANMCFSVKINVLCATYVFIR